MKKTVVMASLVAASTLMMAMDLQYFLGGGAGASLNKVESSIQTSGYVFSIPPCWIPTLTILDI